MSEIYQAPNAELTQADDLSQLDKAIEGDYEFSIMDAFNEGRELAEGHKWEIQKAGLLMFLVLLPAYFLFLLAPSFLVDAESIGLSASLSIAGNLAYYFISTPITAGFLLMAANRATGGDIDSSFLWAYFSQAPKLLGTFIVMYILMMIGFVLLVIPGIYLMIGYTFAIALAADKNLGVWEALETSRKAISKRWFAFFGFIMFLGLINLIAMIPLGLGLIWTFPWSVCAFGVAYRNLFGFEGKTSNA